MRLQFTLAGLLTLLFAVPAYAHTGDHTVFSFGSGFLHPLTGLDHLLAMFAVGLLAVQVGGRGLWMIPAAFVGMMILGALGGLTGAEIPGIELGIVLSIIAIALPVALAFGMPTSIAMAYVGFFALFHGYAHGLELPAGADAAPYIAGFAIATALIHAAGITLGLAFGKLAAAQGTLALRAAGGAIVLAGLAIVVL